MSFKVQTPREPDTSLPRPHHTSAGGSRGQACTPPSPPGRGGNTARPARRPNSLQPAWPLFTHLGMCRINRFNIFSKVPLDPIDT